VWEDVGKNDGRTWKTWKPSGHHLQGFQLRAERIRGFVNGARVAKWTHAVCIIEAGRELIEAKKHCQKEGRQWLLWLQGNFA